MCLNDISNGNSAVIKSVGIPGSYGEKLMEMGLVSGTTIRIIRRNSGLLVMELRGFYLSIRLNTAKQITVFN